ncbi:MAG TPA: thiol reductant ABC exporter subunit CydD [Solirubrobacteraceae bacterium]
MRALARAGQRVVDPRLLTYARATRPFLVALSLLGVVSALLVVAQAWLLADVIAAALAGGKSVAQLRVAFEVLVCVVVARAAVAWGREVLADRSSARAKAQLRAALLEHVAALGPERPGGRRLGELAVLATRGIDALDGYFSLYLPQLVLAVVVPVAVLAVVLESDWISALIIAGTLPLIPLFMALVGATTRDRMELQVRTLQQLAGHFLDVVGGLPTLKVFGRAKAQTRAIGEVTDRYRRAAVSTLRVTFLSSLVLELVATISVALVAVEVGLRLMGGHLGLRTALLVVVLAPEAYLPLRLLGANYHASAEGVSAAQQVFTVLETPLPPRGRRTDVPDPGLTGISVEDLRVHYPGRAGPALDGISLAVQPGEVLAITGPSGCGKSTLLSVLLGFLAPQGGSVRVGEQDLTALDPDAWRTHIAWMPQRPHLFAASIADNIRLGRRDATSGEVREAVVAAGLSDVLATRPEGLDTVLGDRGAGLSVGERQRVALARAFLRDAPLLLLDEPTANLDGATENEVLAALERLVRGRTAVLVAHRPALVALADRRLDLGGLPVAV